MRRVYLDHAATSWPKPPGVVQALVDYQENYGAAAGRGSYAAASRANQIVSSVRRRLSQLIGGQSPNEIAILHNGTAALNLALAGALKPGDHVVTTAAEHNSVLRPLASLQSRIGISFTVVDSNESGYIVPEAIERAIKPSTRMIVVTHASNVTGTIQSIEEIAMIAERHSVWLVVDAAQTLGYVPINVRRLGIDMLAAPGHKGACGMLGTGFLYVRQELAEEIQTPWPGGTGTESDRLEGPFGWPEGVEAGNLNVPALAAWDCGLDWLLFKAVDQRHAESQWMLERLLEILRRSSIGSVIGHRSTDDCVPVVSLAVSKMACSDLAAVLDSSFQIEVRSGMHCAAKIHDCLGTTALGGTLRFSLGHTSTLEDLEALETACTELSKGL